MHRPEKRFNKSRSVHIVPVPMAQTSPTTVPTSQHDPSVTGKYTETFPTTCSAIVILNFHFIKYQFQHYSCYITAAEASIQVFLKFLSPILCTIAHAKSQLLASVTSLDCGNDF